MRPRANSLPVLLTVTALLLAGAGAGFGLTARYRSSALQLGRQSDGSFVVSSGQHVGPGAIAFDGRPIDIALHPSEDVAAVLSHNQVLLISRNGVVPGASVSLGQDIGAAYRGAVWTPAGDRLFVSTEAGYIQEIQRNGSALTLGVRIVPETPPAKPAPEEEDKDEAETSRERQHPQPSAPRPQNPRPGGMVITRDGSRLYVVLCDHNAVAEIDLKTGKTLRSWPVQNLPFEVRLSPDEKTLIVSNWGGRIAREEDETAESAAALIVVDPRGAPASGTVSLIDTTTGKTRHVPVGLHPTGIAVGADNRAYVANAASDTISVLDLAEARVVRTIPVAWGKQMVFGSMPSALELRGETLYACNGGDNALCEIDVRTGKVHGFRPAGYFPTGLALSRDNKTAFVVNTKGNGSVTRTLQGKPGNAHDFQGTVSVIDLTTDLKAATAQVAAANGWNRDRKALKPDLAVYKGAIRHVLYIIKENRTYDEVFGDLAEGNGEKSLCSLGPFMPNHRALARQFTLFDNGYVSGTNSADGHAWSNQAIANDYLEHFYTGYRTYPDDGDCAMSISSGGNLWDAALKKKKTIRVYGEFCDDRMATFKPAPKDWREMWLDRKTRRIKVKVDTRVASLKKLIHPEVVYWPLIQSDQVRADLFIEEYQKFSRADRVPNLMVLSLPCDHTEGRDPKYPTPQSMFADNDLALGRVVEAVSQSPQWKDTCIFVIEDDAQSGPDHVDGHRTVFMAFSPYVKRKFVDSSLYTTASMLRSIELMLGLDPMTRFDALNPPLAACFTDTPDRTPYRAVPNTVALDEMNPPLEKQTGRERYWTEQSLALDWSGLDRADPETLNRILWHTVRGVDTPYPAGGGRTTTALSPIDREADAR